MRLKSYFRAEGIGDQEAAHLQRRIGILQQAMGIELYNKYLDAAGGEADNHDFKGIVAAVKKIVQPTPLEIAERFRFANCKQLKTESPSEYMAALHKLVLTCNFAGDADKIADRRLRDQFIFGLNDEEMQRQLLQETELTAETVVQHSERFNRARSSAALFQGTSSESDVHQTSGQRHNRSRSSSKTPVATSSTDKQRNWGPCTHCGNRHDAKHCKFRSAECYQCGRKGHIRKVCRQRSPSRSHRNLRSSVEGTNVAAANSEEIEDSNYIHQINSASPRYCVDLRSDRTTITMELDTGSGHTIISRPDWERMGSPRLKPSTTIFQSYSGHILPILGCGRMDVQIVPVRRGKRRTYPSKL